jgi:hypothetical protein
MIIKICIKKGKKMRFIIKNFYYKYIIIIISLFRGFTLRIQNNDVELNVLKIASMSEDIGTYK